MGSFPERIKRSSQRGGRLYRELGKSSSLTNIFIILTFKSSDCSDRSLISEGLPLSILSSDFREDEFLREE